MFVCVFLFVYLFTLFSDTYKSAVIETVIKVHIHNAIGPEKNEQENSNIVDRDFGEIFCVDDLRDSH